MMKWLLSTYLIITSVFCFTQELYSTLNHPRILVGEQTELTLKIKLKKGQKVIFNHLNAIIPAKLQNGKSTLKTSESVELEIVEGFTDTLIKNSTSATWIGKYIITCWDSGTIVLPEQMVVIDDSTFYFKSVILNCGLVPSLKSQDIFDIKESFAEVPDPETYIDKFVRYTITNWYWALPVFLILTFIVVQFIRYKKANKVEPKVKEVSLKDRTIIAIESLEKRKMWEDGLLKEHYVELSYIMRSYLSARYQLNLLEKTTLETKLLLHQVGLHPETVDTLLIILNQADMVKFAKSQPDEMSILKVSILAKQIVAETSPIEFEDVE